MGHLAETAKERWQRRASTDSSTARLDEIDLQLIELLQTDGRITLSELGRRVRLSPAAVGERVRRLEGTGTITGYRAVVSLASLGYGIVAFVRVDPLAGFTLRAPRPRKLLGQPEFLEAHHVVGEDCWILKVAVRDTAHLEKLLEQISAFGRTTTSIVLSSPVDDAVRRPLDSQPGDSHDRRRP